MSKKYLTPWYKNDKSYIPYATNVIGGGRFYVLPHQTGWYIRTNTGELGYLAMCCVYKRAEDAKAALEIKLTELGYVMLTQEQMDKLSVLL